jgi:hypothetical protein
MSRDKQKNDKALGMKTQRVVDGSEQTIEFFKKLDPAKPKPLEERIAEDFEVTRQGVRRSTEYLFCSCLKIIVESVIAECLLDRQ